MITVNRDGGELGAPSVEQLRRRLICRLIIFSGLDAEQVQLAIERHDKRVPLHDWTSEEKLCVICAYRKPQAYSWNAG